MKKHLIAVAAVVALLTGLAAAADESATRPAEKEEPVTPAENLAIAEAVAPSLVRVEYTLQHDKGESPKGSGWSKRCPNCGRYHGVSAETPITEERPLESRGFLLSPTRVISPDMMMHPRFIKDIAVRFGEQVVKAKPATFAKGHNALFLDLAEPLKEAKPLAFDTKAKPPYMAVTYSCANGAWTTNVKALGMAVSATEWGRKFRAAPSYCVIVDKKGVPVGMCMKDELPIDDSWKGSPLKWQVYTAKEVESLLADTETRSGGGLPRVALSFRSPKKRPGFDRYSISEEDQKTERNVLGVLMDKETILVLASLKPKVTARLQRILVHPPEGKPVAAKFQHSLKDYGCFVAKLEKPLDGAAKLSMRKITDYRNMMLPAAEIKLQGEKRVAYHVRSRIASYDIGWRRKTFPTVAGRDDGLYLFDPSGDLVALPVMRRPKAAIGRDWDSGRTTLTPASHLKEVFADLAKNADPSNVPLTEAEENRLAWLGVVMQRLDKELARINNVSDQTRDGQTGGLISYVYPGSPADKAGIKVGHILLRLHVKDRPQPIEVELGRYGLGDRPFPWDRLDEMPEQYYDRIPQPWPSAENAFTRALTDLGFGKNYQAEFFADGKAFRKEFTVVASPTHYNSAKRHKDKKLGLTVADLTYEVRRYFQKKPGEPGLILAKIEPGSKASVSGLKPYEIITHVNDKPVRNVADFKKLIAGQSELRLAVKRMTRGRVVKIKMAGRKVPTTRAATGATVPAP